MASHSKHKTPKTIAMKSRSSTNLFALYEPYLAQHLARNLVLQLLLMEGGRGGGKALCKLAFVKIFCEFHKLNESSRNLNEHWHSISKLAEEKKLDSCISAWCFSISCGGR